MIAFDHELLKIPNSIARFSKSLVLITSIFMVVFLGITDYLTGPELSFSIFFLIPITFATLFSGRTTGLLISIISAITWYIADVTTGHTYSTLLIPCWNATVRLGYFSLHTILLSVLLSRVAEMKSLALRDSLTGASNWRFFEETIRREIDIMRRSKKPITMSYIDLDNFKEVNDIFGHDAGDDLLRTVVDTIQRNIRPSDILARIGGDEFALLLPDTDSKSSQVVLTRMRENFNTLMSARGYPVTMSIGVVTFNILPSSVEAMRKRADELMYSVKKDGKNNIKYEEWPPAIAKFH